MLKIGTEMLIGFDMYICASCKHLLEFIKCFRIAAKWLALYDTADLHSGTSHILKELQQRLITEPVQPEIQCACLLHFFFPCFQCLSIGRHQ